MRILVLVGLVLAGSLVFVAMAEFAVGAPQEGRHGVAFDHKKHAELEEAPHKRCDLCHRSSPEGELEGPGSRGHQPCLTAGCHAEDFLSVGGRTRRDAPERYQEAAAFCFGCHQDMGHAPSPSKKQKAETLFQNITNPSHYVEMNHFEHAKLVGCRSCHVVDPTRFELQLEGPQHAQCATCHKKEKTENKKTEIAMKDCEGCHQDGVPSSYFAKRLIDSDVRSCNSVRYQRLLARRGKGRVPPCFKHERREHRFTPREKEIQCATCHFMYKRKKYRGHAYQSLHDVKKAPLIDNHRDRSHKKCGASQCHKREVDDSLGTGRCSMCHSSKRILEELQE